MSKQNYRYRPILFFLLAYICTWVFWVPAIFMKGTAATVLMAAGLLAPPVVSTLFVLLSGSKELKQDLRNKILVY